MIITPNLTEPRAPVDPRASDFSIELSALRDAMLADGELQVCVFDSRLRGCLVTFLLDPEEYHA